MQKVYVERMNEQAVLTNGLTTYSIYGILNGIPRSFASNIRQYSSFRTYAYLSQLIYILVSRSAICVVTME